MKEKGSASTNGWFILVILLIIFGFIGLIVIPDLLTGDFTLGLIVSIPTVLLFFISLSGFYTVEPNDARLLMFTGNYVGTDRESGLRYTIPFYNKVKVSLRVLEYTSGVLKVTDQKGSPIEISTIIIWRIDDTYKALFDVKNYQSYLNTQCESVIRNLAMKYPYESENETEYSLTTHTEEIGVDLQAQLQEKVDIAGLEIIEAKVNHLSYAKEIAAAMLQKQQATAILNARKLIVEGAVTMAEMAIEKLEKRKVVQFNNDEKAKLVSNLMIVLCSEQNTQPTITTGN